MVHRIEKLENPVRLEELSPENTLKRIGLKPGMTFADIGAGTGIFAIPAAKMTWEKVFALEISEEMIQLLNQRKAEAGLDNLDVRKVEKGFPLDDESCDLILMVTVFHELDDKEGMLKEIQRVLMANGRLAIIEFHGYETPMGPPVPHRISKEAVQEYAESNGFCLLESFDLGDNFYCQLYK